ncbi:MAG: cupin domain-containing protein [Candidatus Methylomirabilis sp.]|nr:cupin domain-containing protein [Deltaproteobacteria bacterium]
MRHYSLEGAPERPVSHDPELKKKILLEGPVSCVKRISHIVLEQGATASAHTHDNSSEVFYCVRGAITFSVMGEPILLKSGHLLVVEPGEEHAIVEVSAESEMVYMMVDEPR